MLEHIILSIIGMSGGLIVAFGSVALILELNLISRFAGITHTARYTKLYENSVVFGIVIGNILTIYSIRFPAGGYLAACFGLFGGIYLGSWIIALTEVIDMFPIISKKAGIKVGIRAIVLATAIGKAVFSLLYYYNGW